MSPFQLGIVALVGWLTFCRQDIHLTYNAVRDLLSAIMVAWVIFIGIYESATPSTTLRVAHAARFLTAHVEVEDQPEGDGKDSTVRLSLYSKVSF